MTRPEHLIFVYGTLKQGGSNHAFLHGQRFQCEARTLPGHTLYSLGEYPGLVSEPGDREGVTGELWAVDAACLARLDVLEGLAEGLYAREPAPLLPVTETGAPPAQFYRYLGSVAGCLHLGSTWRS